MFAIIPLISLLTCFVFQWAVHHSGVKAMYVKSMYRVKGMQPVHKNHNMVVFVLDRVIWPFQVSNLNKSLAELSKIDSSQIENLNIFPEVHDCLDMLQNEGFVLAAVCNCKIPTLASKLLDTFDLTRYFAYEVCSEKDRLTHIETLHEQSGVDFGDMLYFDYDLKENLPLIEANITFCPLDDRGMSMEVVEKALQIFAVRTTLKPPMITTMKQKSGPKNSSEWSLEVDYKQFNFKRPSTEEILKDNSDEDSENEY